MTMTVTITRCNSVVPDYVSPVEGDEETERTFPVENEEDFSFSSGGDGDIVGVGGGSNNDKEKDELNLLPVRGLGLNHYDSIRLLTGSNKEDNRDDDDTEEDEDDDEEEKLEEEMPAPAVVYPPRSPIPPPIQTLNQGDEDDEEQDVYSDAVTTSASAATVVSAIPVAGHFVERRISFGVPAILDTTIVPLKSKQDNNDASNSTATTTTVLPPTAHHRRRVSFNEDVTLNHVENFRYVLKKRERHAIWYSENEMHMIEMEVLTEQAKADEQQQKDGMKNKKKTKTSFFKKITKSKKKEKKKNKIESHNGSVMGMYIKVTKQKDRKQQEQQQQKKKTIPSESSFTTFNTPKSRGGRFSLIKKAKSVTSLFGEQSQQPKLTVLESVHGNGGIVAGGYI